MSQPPLTTPQRTESRIGGSLPHRTAVAVGLVKVSIAVRDRAAAVATSWPLLGIVGTTLLAAALRLPRLDYLGLRIDEGFTLLYSRQSWAAVLGFDGYYAPHPPLFFALAKLANVFVAESIASRTVAAVAGIATIPIVYDLGRRLLDARAGLAAALLVAVSPLHLEFSRDGRMYAPATLVIVVAYDALFAYWQQPSRRTAVIFGLALATGVYIDYSAAYALAPLCLLMAWVVWQQRRRAAWLVGATAAAVLAYAPWLPQIVRTIDGVNEIERRSEYLAATWNEVWDAIPFLVGLDGRASGPSMSWPNAWDRWTNLHTPFLLLLIPAGVVGALVLRRNRLGLATVAALVLGVPVMAVLISKISPGFAVRTLIPATVGWSLLAGAVMARDRGPGGIPRWLRALGIAGWCYLLVVSVVALPPVYSNSGRVRWNDAAADLARLNTDNAPIVTFSIGGMDTDLIDLYAGNRLTNPRFITVVDGREEERTGAQRWLDRGPSLHDVEEGRLADLLPATPENAEVWFLTHRSTGSPTVREALASLGYRLLLRRGYTGMLMELYARPGANLGQALDLNLGGNQELTIPEGAEPITASTAASALAGLYTLEVEAHTDGTTTGAHATIRCLAAGGSVLAEESRTTEDDGTAWQDLIMAVPCPDGTVQIGVALATTGATEAAFRNVRLWGRPDAPAAGS